VDGELAAIRFAIPDLSEIVRGHGGELSWTLEDNDAVHKVINRTGAQVYRLYERALGYP
jgi:hypothetical protein